MQMPINGKMALTNKALENEDIIIVFDVADDMINITGLVNKADGYNWVNVDSGWVFPLLSGARIAGDADDIRIHWSFDKDASAEQVSGITGKKISLVFVSENPALTLTSVWEIKDNQCGPVEHSMTITNNTDAVVTIYQQESLDIAVRSENALRAFYLCKGSARDGSGGNINIDVLSDNYNKDIYAVPVTCFNYVPWLSLNDAVANRGLYIGWEWPDGRINLTSGAGNTAHVKAGLGIPEIGEDGVSILEFKTDIESGETFEVPAAFIGAYSGKNTAYAENAADKLLRLVDDGCNKMRKWLFKYLMPDLNRNNASLPEIEYSVNHAIGLLDASVPGGAQLGWLGCDGRKLETIVKDVYDKNLGFDDICVDNGWANITGEYGNDPTYWPALDIGSDLPVMRQYSDMVQKTYGFNRFQLYFAFHDGRSTVQDSLSSRDKDGKLVNPEWFCEQQNDGDEQYKLPYHGLKADLGNTKCVDALKKLLRDKLTEYNVNYIKTDYDPIITDSYYQGVPFCKHKYGQVDTGYWAAKGFYEVLKYLIDNVADFKCQINNCGGNLRDYASAKYGSTIPARDDYGVGMTPEDSRLALWESLYCFPAMQLTVPYAGDGACGGAYRYRSWMMAAPFTMTEAPSDMEPEEIDILRNCIISYKKNVRQLIRDGEVYHILPRANQGDWDGIEYYDPDTGKGVAMLFRGKGEDGKAVSNHRNVRLRGLDPKSAYKFRFEDGSNPSLEKSAFTGERLMKNGLDLILGGHDEIASEWMFFEKSDSKC